jgi:CelD/BcsL family acetyltransferase involved in cellulose biosynthesis
MIDEYKGFYRINVKNILRSRPDLLYNLPDVSSLNMKTDAHYSILTQDEELTALVPEWDELQRRCGRTVFTASHWIEGWWRFIGKEQGYRLHIVTGRKSGRLVAVAPLAVIRRKSLNLLLWAAGDACDYSDFLCEAPEDAAMLLEAIRKSPHYDVATLRDVYEQAACSPVLADKATTVKHTEVRAIRNEGKTFEEWFATLPYAARKQHRARLKQIQALGELRYEVFRDTPVSDAALTALIEQKKEWLARAGEVSMFSAPGIYDFCRTLTNAAAKDGTLHFSLLRCGDEIIATHLGFVQDGRFLSYMASYSSKWSNVSPGRTMMFRCIEWAFSNGCNEYDFMRGNEGYKHSFANSARALKGFLFARGWKGELAKLVYLQRQKRRKAA